jgi:SAM-dependent methyltransferase
MDNHYHEPFLVSIYDVVNTSRTDFDFYLGQLPKPPARVLDIGCGTGTFATELADRGYSVIGVDPAPEMIAAARAKKGAEAVDWITGFASDVPPDSFVDVAVMTGHAFQCLLRDEDISMLFQSVAACLKQDGSFWFETRNAGVQPWTKWTPEHSGPPIVLPNGRRVRVVHRVLEVKGEYVSFEETYEISGIDSPLTSRSTLRFPPLEKIEQLARERGLRVKESFGNWAKGALSDSSPEIIVCLEKYE